MRFLLSLLFVTAIVVSGLAVALVTTANQGSWSLGFPLPWTAAPAVASTEVPASGADQTAVTVLPGQPIGDWLLNCGTNVQTARKQCTMTQQLTDKRTQSVVFTWLIGDDGAGNLVAVWRTPAGVMLNRGVVIDVGNQQPIAVPYTSCASGQCEAVANLAPDFIDTLSRAARARATVYTVGGEGLTFALSVHGLAQALDAVKASSAG